MNSLIELLIFGALYFFAFYDPITDTCIVGTSITKYSFENEAVFFSDLTLRIYHNNNEKLT